MTNTCPKCNTLGAKVIWAEADVHSRARRAAFRPDDARRNEQLVAAKAHLATQRDRLDEHEAECDFPQVERPIKDVRPKAAPKPKRAPKVIEIDRRAVATALAVKAEPRVEARGSNTLPATGHCHTCDRRVSGERRFCGRCAARRSR